MITERSAIYGAAVLIIAAVTALAIVHETRAPAVRPKVEPPPVEITTPKDDRSVLTSIPVRTIPIVAMPLMAGLDVAKPMPPAAPAPEPAPPLKPKRAGDICAQHGGERVDDPGRHSWHCAFKKRGTK